MIHELLPLPTSTAATSSLTLYPRLHHDYHHYETPIPTDPHTLYIHTLNPISSPPARPPTTTAIRRTPYRFRGSRFRARTLPTTYTVLQHPHATHLRATAPALLRTSRQLHAEAAALLYGAYTLAFGTAVETPSSPSSPICRPRPAAPSAACG
jgi:hypothetical protein